MGCESTRLRNAAEYRIQVRSEKHCNGSPAKQNEFAAFWRLVMQHHWCARDGDTVSEAFGNLSMLGQLLLKWT